MYKRVAILVMCLSTVLGFCQSAPKYQTASILEVVPLQTTANESDSVPVYKITLQTSSTTYVVLYTYSPNTELVRYSTGMQTTVLVEENSIKFNDILGRTYELPIIGRRPVRASKSKQDGSPMSSSAS